MPTKIEKTSQAAHLPALVLYRDDLDELERIARPTKIEVVVADLSFVSLEELKDHSGPIQRRLDLTFHIGPGEAFPDSVTVLFSHTHTWLQFRGKSDNVKLTFFAFRDLLRQRRPWYLRWPTSPLLWLGMAIMASSAAASILASDLSSQVKILAWCVAALVLVPVVVSDRIRKLGPRVDLRRRHEATNFWRRNSDDLIKISLGAILGAVVTAIVHQLT